METLDPQTGKVVGPRGAKGYKRWEPKEWLPVYEAIVTLSCTGLYSNEEVGKRFGYGKQQVSNILNTPQAKKLKQQLAEKVRSENSTTIADRIAQINDSALKHVEFVMNRQSEDFKNPLAIFDRSRKWLQDSGVLKSDTPAPPQGGSVHNTTIHAMILNGEGTERLTEGLNRANQVRVIHGSKSSEPEP